MNGLKQFAKFFDFAKIFTKKCVHEVNDYAGKDWKLLYFKNKN